jgi:hypothetical protein
MWNFRHNNPVSIWRELDVHVQAIDVISKLSFRYDNLRPNAGFCRMALLQSRRYRLLCKDRCMLVWNKTLGQFQSVAAHALQHLPQLTLTTLLGCGPSPIYEGGTMPDVLRMPTVKNRHPIPMLVSAECRDRTFHGLSFLPSTRMSLGDRCCSSSLPTLTTSLQAPAGTPVFKRASSTDSTDANFRPLCAMNQDGYRQSIAVRAGFRE